MTRKEFEEVLEVYHNLIMMESRLSGWEHATDDYSCDHYKNQHQQLFGKEIKDGKYSFDQVRKEMIEFYRFRAVYQSLCFNDRIKNWK
jgi:hypothetical protein